MTTEMKMETRNLASLRPAEYNPRVQLQPADPEYQNIKRSIETFGYVHPTMKPVNLVGRLMRNSSKPGWNVLDLFGGSGSTLMAAEQIGRRAFLMELDEKFCDVIVHRWEEFTGKKAVRAGKLEVSL